MTQIKPTKEDQRDWIGVDLDGTLSHWSKWTAPTDIGAPIPAMVARVQGWIRAGERVKILTARAQHPDAISAIYDWVERHVLGPMRDERPKFRDASFVGTLYHDFKVPDSLEITTSKDHLMTVLWDDRAVEVVRNTGMSKTEILEEENERLRDLVRDVQAQYKLVWGQAAQELVGRIKDLLQKKAASGF